MAQDMFIKIGNIEGESQDSQHKGEIDVLSWNWGMSQSGTAQLGGGAGGGKANVEPLTVTKYVDKATPDLRLSCLKGTHHKEAKLTVRKAGGEKPVDYLVITMGEVLIKNVDGAHHASEDRFTENVSLDFRTVKIEYAEQTATGGVGATPKMSYDIGTQK